MYYCARYDGSVPSGLSPDISIEVAIPATCGPLNPSPFEQLEPLAVFPAPRSSFAIAEFDITADQLQRVLNPNTTVAVAVYGKPGCTASSATNTSHIPLGAMGNLNSAFDKYAPAYIAPLTTVSSCNFGNFAVPPVWAMPIYTTFHTDFVVCVQEQPGASAE